MKEEPYCKTFSLINELQLYKVMELLLFSHYVFPLFFCKMYHFTSLDPPPSRFKSEYLNTSDVDPFLTQSDLDFIMLHNGDLTWTQLTCLDENSSGFISFFFFLINMCLDKHLQCADLFLLFFFYLRLKRRLENPEFHLSRLLSKT